MMFNNKLKEYRELRRMSQSELAKKARLSRSSISMYESGERKPSFEALEAIADILNVSFNDLMGVNEKEYLFGLSKPQFNGAVPRLGRIACGDPILADENIEGYDMVPEGITCDFTLICEGDSMTGARIFDGDIVYIQQTPEIENGQIAAVRIGEETTLKRFYREGDTVTLLPENPRYQPRVFIGAQLDSIQIIGRAVAFTSTVR